MRALLRVREVSWPEDSAVEAVTEVQTRGVIIPRVGAESRSFVADFRGVAFGASEFLRSTQWPRAQPNAGV